MPLVHQAALNAGEISPSLHARIDLDKYQRALKTCTNFFVHEHGGISNRPGLQYIGDTVEHSSKTRLIPFEFNTEQTYVLAFGDYTMKVFKDAGEVSDTATVTGATNANPCVVTMVGHPYQDGDLINFSDVGGMTELNGNDYVVQNKTANTVELKGIDSTAYGTYTTGGTAEYLGVETPYAVADLWGLRFKQSADTMEIVSASYAPYTLTRTGHTDWTLAAKTFGASLSAPTGLVGTATTGTAITFKYKVTAVDEYGEESLPSSEDSIASDALSETNPMSLTWNTVSGASRYNVYKYRGGRFGYIGTADTNSFSDTGFSADISDAPPESNDPFASSNNPQAVVYHQQRLALAGLVNDPQEVNFSGLGAYANFNLYYPLKADSAFAVTLNNDKVNEVRHLVSANALLVFTSGAVWAIDAGTGAFTPANVRAKKQSAVGCSDVPPLETYESVLYVSANGAEVRDLVYQITEDGYKGRDLSIMAKHLLEGYTIVDWCYAPLPHSIIWLVRSDGVLLGLTYNREHDVWAWHKHTTDGSFESVASVQEGNESAVYVVVKRTIQSSTVRYVERMASRSFATMADAKFSDSFLTYDGAAVNVIPGLDHLIGETVAVLGDGNVFDPLVVDGSGQVTLPNSVTVSKAQIGLPYTSEMETLRPASGGQSITANPKNVIEVYLQVQNTRGLWAGPDTENVREYKPPAMEDYGGPISTETDLIKIKTPPRWTDAGRVYVKQVDPLPATILSIITNLDFGEV